MPGPDMVLPHAGERAWSPQQRAIFDWFASPHRAAANCCNHPELHTGQLFDNLVVRARAGTGKTTTILEAINRAPEQRILLCAFNKRIAEELTARLKNPHAEAKTLHSVGFSFVLRNWKGVRVDGERGWRIARHVWAMHKSASGDRRPLYALEEAAPDPVVAAVVRLAALGKNAAPRATVEALVDLAYTYNVQPENGWADEYDVEAVAEMAHLAMNQAQRRDGSIDFDDMVYLPVVHQWARPTYDLIVVDEAQDMNASQLALALAIARGRIAVVGDDRQAIYGFRGADSGALERLKLDLRAAELPLTVTYRCPKSVVTVAHALVPDYQAADSAPEGEVLSLSEEVMMKTAEPSDFVLSRTNAPLARLCLAFLRQGTKARIEGRDVSKGLVALVKRMRADSIPDLVGKLYLWQEREIAKLTATKRQSAQVRIDYVADQVETLEALSDGLADTAELVARIDDLFGEARGPTVVLSTVHRAKGLEADRVFLLTSTLYCNGKRNTPEEANIHYVAVTRAKHTLALVEA